MLCAAYSQYVRRLVSVSEDFDVYQVADFRRRPFRRLIPRGIGWPGSSRWLGILYAANGAMDLTAPRLWIGG